MLASAARSVELENIETQMAFTISRFNGLWTWVELWLKRKCDRCGEIEKAFQRRRVSTTPCGF